MKLTKLLIKNFRGVSNLELDFADGVNVVCGKNGIGKTTVVDSVLWLLADETIVYGGTNSENLNKNNLKEEVEVTGIFTKDDGTELEFKRIYKQKYSKEGQFSDYSNELYINNAKYNVKEYNIRIYKEIGLDTDFIIKGFNDIRALMDFDYFGNIDYKKAREKLEKILNISSDDELGSKEEYEPIRKDLKALLYDTAKANTMYNKEIKENQLLLEKKEAVLEEKQKNLAKKVDQEKIEELKKQLDEVSKHEFEFSADYDDKRNKLAKLREEQEKNYSAYESFKQSFNTLRTQNENLLNQVKHLKNEFDAYKDQYETVKNSITVCPNCKYELNKEEINKKLVSIGSKAKETKDKLIELSKNEVFVKYKETSNNYDAQTKDYVEKDKTLSQSINELVASLKEEDEKYKQFEILKAQKETSLKTELNILSIQGESENLTPYIEEIAKIKENIANAELKGQLLEEFKKDKIEYIKQKTSTIFPDIDFVLVEISSSGAVSQTCKATYKGVDYLGLNDAQRIIIGVQVIECIRKAFNITETLPIIINKFGDLDNENKRGIKKYTNCQILTTYSSSDEKIKIMNI